MYRVMYKSDAQYVSCRTGIYYYTRRVPIDNETYLKCLSDPKYLEEVILKLWPAGFDPTSSIAKSVISDNGDFYKSVKEAAKAEGISAGHLSNSIKNEKKINGKVFSYT